ncbi:hypothetical protein BaRGS_00040025 [Batillaria attramentaria]|uniref:Uncharacterized protein n=1 Tax=Batillaria attramentaria TaxID=370345 RepID=A0ABD0J1H7_9CAEN
MNPNGIRLSHARGHRSSIGMATRIEGPKMPCLSAQLTWETSSPIVGDTVLGRPPAISGFQGNVLQEDCKKLLAWRRRGEDGRGSCQKMRERERLPATPHPPTRDHSPSRSQTGQGQAGSQPTFSCQLTQQYQTSSLSLPPTSIEMTDVGVHASLRARECSPVHSDDHTQRWTSGSNKKRPARHTRHEPRTACNVQVLRTTGTQDANHCTTHHGTSRICC